MSDPANTQQPARYDEGGQRLTTCCGCYSTYYDADLVCKSCYHIVPDGEGDGTDFLSIRHEATYHEWVRKMEREAVS